MKKLILFLVFIAFNSNVNSQVFVNRVYQDISANPVFNPVLNAFGVNWSKSITNTNNELITVGHTTVSGQGENLYLEKRGGGGNLIFSISKNTTSTNNDYGIDVLEPSPGGDIYVCGVTDNSTSNNFDIIIYRYSSTGSLLDSAQYDNGLNYNDIVSALTVDASGNIVLAASTKVSNGTYDYLALKYSSNLSYVNSNTYDYSGLDDAAIGLEINSINGNICVIGASASTSITGEYAVAYFDGTSLGYLSDERSSIPGTALDQPLSYCKNSSNDIFMTGKAWNGTNFDIKTIKISSTYSLSWSSPLDIKGFDDVGTSIALDPVNGNIIVGGFATNSNNVKELMCLRLDASTGTVITSHDQISENSSGDAFVKAVTTNALGDVYFIGEEKGNSGNRQVIIGKIKSNGQQSWQRKVTNNNYNVNASDIELASDGICIISILDSSVVKYIETKYSELELDTNLVYASNGKPAFKKNELIVRFSPSVLDSNAIDNKIGTANKTFANLNYYLAPTPYSQFMSAINADCSECPIKAIKVFPYLTTTFTTTTSQLGENVNVPDFWTTLLLVFPDNTNLQQVCQDLEDIPNVVGYSHPNFVAKISNATDGTAGPSTVTATDPLLGNQYSLYGHGAFPNAGIGIIDAWTVDGNAGQPYIRGGVFDTGIEWRHEDFGWDGINDSTSRVKDGWDFRHSANFRTRQYPDYSNHGTDGASIIGAIRGNSVGIAGIAGGNTAWAHDGVSLYSLGILELMDSLIYLNFVADAMVTSCFKNLISPYAYGLNFQNHSWRFDNFSATTWNLDTNINLMTDAAHFVNRLKVTIIAARGNEGVNNRCIPATIHDDWILNVGGTSYDGEYIHLGVNSTIFSASYGRDIDIAAPASESIIVSCAASSSANPNYTTYTHFRGTSAAAPHVSGGVALLMGYMNDSIANYKNLAPEDCEHILQYSATDVGVTGPDSLTGYGRLNIGAAMRLVEKPFYTLYHFGTNSLTPYSMQISMPYGNTTTTVNLTERFQKVNQAPLAKGKYSIKTFKIDAIINHSLTFPTDSIKYYWKRPSSSALMPLFINNKLQPREDFIINSLTSSNANVTGYTYQIYDSTGTTVYGWIPCDTNFNCTNLGSLFEYSLLTKNTALGINENSKVLKEINLYPNPSNHIQTLEINCAIESKCEITIMDLLGRNVVNLYQGKLVFGKNKIITNISELKSTIYFYAIKIDNYTYYKKFIKTE